MLSEYRHVADEMYREILKSVEKIGPCDYEVQRYSSSLRQLVISVTPLDDNNLLKLKQRQFLLFSGVQYLQLLPNWINSPLFWLDSDEREPFLRKLGVDYTPDSYPRVAHAEVGSLNVCVVFSSVELEETMPKVYEYSFS